MKFYHATQCDNARKIVSDGKIKAHAGEVFLCRTPLDACKFLVIRGVKKITVFELNLKKDEVHESFDHSEAFFQCKAYVHDGDIILNAGVKIMRYEFEF